MDQYVTGAMIRRLREERKLTQQQLAEKTGVSDKARFKIRGTKKIYWYCNRDGLFGCAVPLKDP